MGYRRTTPSVCRHTDTPPGEGNIPVYNRESDKVVRWNSTENYLLTREGIKLHSRKLPKAELLKPTSKKKYRTFPSLGGVSAARADDGVVQWVVLIGMV